jgi:hypothetical protein
LARPDLRFQEAVERRADSAEGRIFLWCPQGPSLAVEVGAVPLAPGAAPAVAAGADAGTLLLALEHEPVPARAAASLRRGYAPFTEAPWLAVLGRASLKIKHSDLPFPQVQRVSEVAELLVATEVKLAEALGSRPAAGDGELLAVDLEGVAEV